MKYSLTGLLTFWVGPRCHSRVVCRLRLEKENQRYIIQSRSHDAERSAEGDRPLFQDRRLSQQSPVFISIKVSQVRCRLFPYLLSTWGFTGFPEQYHTACSTMFGLSPWIHCNTVLFAHEYTYLISLVVVPFIFWAVQTSKFHRLLSFSFLSAAYTIIGFSCVTPVRTPPKGNRCLDGIY